MTEQEKATGANQPFDIDMSGAMNPAEMFFGRGAKVVHPCDAFAERAGYGSWGAAREAMRAGKILRAAGPRIGRTMIDFNLFANQIKRDGLLMVTPANNDFGLVAVGKRECFPKETLARLDADADRREPINPFRAV